MPKQIKRDKIYQAEAAETCFPFYPLTLDPRQKLQSLENDCYPSNFASASGLLLLGIQNIVSGKYEAAWPLRSLAALNDGHITCLKLTGHANWSPGPAILPSRE